jgi:hypothetical protein
MTGDDVSALAPTALCRLYCYYIIGQLSEASITEACQSLAEIYSWQTNKPAARSEAPQPQSLGYPAVKDVERVPFVYRED